MYLRCRRWIHSLQIKYRNDSSIGAGRLREWNMSCGRKRCGCFLQGFITSYKTKKWLETKYLKICYLQSHTFIFIGVKPKVVIRSRSNHARPWINHHKQVSCPRTLQHVDYRGQGLKPRPSDWVTTAPKLQPINEVVLVWSQDLADSTVMSVGEGGLKHPGISKWRWCLAIKQPKSDHFHPWSSNRCFKPNHHCSRTKTKNLNLSRGIRTCLRFCINVLYCLNVLLMSI